MDGSPVEFMDEVIGSGAMKDVYFSPDKSYVVGFFRTPQDANSVDRLKNITGVYRERIFNQVGGEYWKNLFCWPTKMVEWNGKLGIVCPSYQSHFFFSSGMFKGKEKEGKWFASARLRNKFLPADQKGSWLDYFHICIQIARAVKAARGRPRALGSLIQERPRRSAYGKGLHHRLRRTCCPREVSA